MIDFWSEQNNLSTKRSANSTLIKSFHGPISLQCCVNNNSIPQLLFRCDLICFCFVRSTLVVIPIQILGSLREGKYGICVNNPWLRVRRSESLQTFIVPCVISVLHRYLSIHCVAISWTTFAHQGSNRDSPSLLRTLWSAVIVSPHFSTRRTRSPLPHEKQLQGAPVAFVRLHT